jgi:hypothetical protein
MRVRRCSECGVHTMEDRCQGCGSTALAAVAMARGDRDPSPRGIEIRRVLGFGLLDAALGKRLADELPSAAPRPRVSA